MECANFIVENTERRRGLNDIEHVLGAMHGVSSVRVNQQHQLVSVEYDSSGVSYDKIENRLNGMGFEIAADASLINTR